MATVSESIEIPASADEVWALAGRPEAIADWHPALASSPVDAAGVRRIETADGGSLVENILEHSDERREYTYDIVESPFGFSSYVATISVEPHGDGARVVWKAEFEAGDPAQTDELVPVMTGLYRQGLEALREQVLAAAPG